MSVIFHPCGFLSRCRHYSSFSLHTCFLALFQCTSLLMKIDDVRSQSGSSIANIVFCVVMMMGERRDVTTPTAATDASNGAAVSDLELVGQAAAGVAGITHSVQGLTGKLRGPLHHEALFHVCHLGGHQERGDALGKDVVGQVEFPLCSFKVTYNLRLPNIRCSAPFCLQPHMQQRQKEYDFILESWISNLRICPEIKSHLESRGSLF